MPRKKITIEKSVPPAVIEDNIIGMHELYGVNLNEFTYEDHPDYTNPKATLREDVINIIHTSLEDGTLLVENIPPIDIASVDDMDGDGIQGYIVADGVHRVIALLRYYAAHPELPPEIKVNKLTLTSEGVVYHKLQTAFNESRSNLTDSEVVSYIKTFLMAKYSTDRIVEQLGVKYKRYVDMVKSIVSGSQALEDAVVSGEVPAKVAAKIANTTPSVADQASKIERYKATAKNEGVAEANDEAGVRNKTRTTLTTKGVLQLLVAEDLDGFVKEKCHQYTEGFIQALLYVLKLEHTLSEDLIETVTSWADELGVTKDA